MKKITRCWPPRAVGWRYCFRHRLLKSPYDLVIKNARIVDGTGNPWYRGDLAIRGDTIARIASVDR